jgi:hypothetical protein
MDRKQFSWLIVRAFGVYLLIQAFILGVAILGEFYMYSRLASLPASSVGTQDYVGAILRSYQTSMAAYLLKLVVFSAAGIYFLLGGRFLMRWLQYIPDVQTNVDAQTIRPNLTEQEARNMSVKERLSAAGLFHEFADAVDRRDASELDRILRQTHLEPDNIQAVIQEVLGTPGDAQQIVGRERRERVL